VAARGPPKGSTLAQVSFDGVTKQFGDTTAVDDLTLHVPDGELLVLLGSSGCGKTTALRLVAGLEDVTGGTVSIGDQVVNDVDPKDRDVAMVFQSYALYPHLTVAKNIEFPLRQRNVEKEERRAKVTRAADTLGLGALLDRKPSQLSGGQRQRVALARAIVREPLVFLMDEPLSNLDAALRVQTRAEIVELQARLSTTTIYVTHDQVEAMTMGHRIAVMSEGRLQQVATPEALYARPANAFVAHFLGSPGMNLLKGMLVESGGAQSALAVALPGSSVPLPTAETDAVRGAGPDVVLGLRPESLRLDPDGPIAATVLLVELLGAETHVICLTEDDERIIVRQGPGAAKPGPGEAVRIAIDPDPSAYHLFDATTGVRLGDAA
jgi:multiple sugar transport system ATP-binding protein